MLRVNVGLSRKLSKDYNSTGYSINLDGEVTASITDAEAVIEQINELFDLAEEALNQEVQRVESTQAIASRDSRCNALEQNGGDNGVTRPNAPSSGHTEEPATNKQVNYLLTLGKRHRLTTAQLEMRASEILGRPVGLYELGKKSAANVIDALANEGNTPARQMAH